eukprot:gene12687-26716_t
MSGASSMRNAVKRITHKERAQPSWRKKMGFLEKHKDYIVRAKDYHKKQDHIRKLKKKADDKNVDEFYFKMNTSEVSGGVHKEIKENTSLDNATVQLLKTQDMGYIVHKKAVDDKKIEKLQKNLHLIGEQRPKSHTVFVDTEEDFDQFNPAEYFQTDPELVDRAFNRPKLTAISEMADSTKTVTEKDLKKALKSREASYKELKQRINRGKKLENVRSHLQTQRNVMGKGTKRKIRDEGDDGTPAIFKWKRERCR